MSKKAMVMLGASIGSTVGGLIPTLWGAGAFSGWGLILATVGGFVGIWAGWKIANG